MPDTSPTCPKCGDALVGEKPFCPNCGLAVGSPASRTAIDSYIQAKIAQELSVRLKDQSSLVREIGDKAEDVVWSRLKRYGWIVTVLIVILGSWGVKSIDDAGKKIVETASQRVEPLIQKAENRVNAAQGKISKTDDALSALESKLIGAQDKLSSYERRMQDYEARVSKSGGDALAQVDSLKTSSTTAFNEISQLRNRMNTQEKELTETGALVKDLAARTLVEGFKTGQTAASDFVIITHETAKQSVYMRLTRKPYPQTVRLQWNTAVQPLDSYLINDNLILLNWADTNTKFSERAIYVSYVADASVPQQQLHRALSVKEKRAFIDGKPLPYIGIPETLPFWMK